MTYDFTTIDPLDWSTLQPHVEALLAAPLTPESEYAWLKGWSDLSAIMQEERAQISRAVSENTADPEADARFKRFIGEIYPALAQADQALRQKWLAFDGAASAAETVLIRRRFQSEADIYRAENVPLISQLRLLGKRYSEIVGGLSITWQGQDLTIPQAEVLAGDPDAGVRKGVWRLVSDAFLAQRGALNDLFMEMLPIRRRMARQAGFGDFRSYQWQALGRFDYTPAECAIFHDAIAQEVTPLASELYRQLAAELGQDRIHPWDTSASAPWQVTIDPADTPLAPFDDTAVLEAGAQRIFDQVDPVLGGYFADMRQGYLDLGTRPHKAPGGFCSSLPISGKPYIFMNAAGTHRNVRTLLHEGGHAFHFAESFRRQTLLWNHNGPMEFCEVASMAMELLSMPYWAAEAGGFYHGPDLNRAITEQLQGLVFFLPYMAVVDLLQHWLYTDAPEGVDPAAIDAKWSDLWDRFLPGIDFGAAQAEKETGWHRKGHIFGAPFYYIEYGLAQIGAMQIWRNARQDQAAAVRAYRQALAAGATRPLPDLFALAGARFAFDRQTVGELMTLVKQQLDALAV
ncbi:MAG: M3 family oligoendopeptidase [Caldilineales bacterium]|nr:M3 family oligoendopeptidase [Caldilineales bacterium]